jgi:t-SNARE complex subunit (syntaxin)
MQESMLHSLTNKFQGTMQKFQEYQLEYQKTVRDKVRRQIREVDEDISEDKLKELENNPEAVSEMMSQKLGLPHYRLRNEFSDIQEKYEAIKQLESVKRL